MTAPDPTADRRAADVTTVAVIGAGAIGLSWATQFMAAGLDVIVTDPDPGAEANLADAIATQWPILERMGLAPGAAPNRYRLLTGTGDQADAALADALAEADFVQENGPERLEVKTALLARIDAATRPEVVIASSSSGLMASQIQVDCRHPQRVVIGHPFYPPHLIPVVEVIGGAATDDRSVDTAVAFYRRMGKRPIRINTELPGHVVNRLQAALWREAYHLVSTGAASVADIDTAIAYGPGLRWSLLGPFATQHLSGGAGGLQHVLDHLGPPMVEWWDTLQTPDWNEHTVAAAVDGVNAELADLDQAAMMAERDALLEQLLAAKAAARHLPGSRPEEPHAY